MFKRNKLMDKPLGLNGKIEENIEVEQITVAYDKNDVIKNMSLSIPKGQITIIIGKNGCGKSTLLKSMARILQLKSGSIKVNGLDITKQSPKDVAKMMAVLPQSPSTPSGLLVRELVSYGRFPHQKAMAVLSTHDYEIIDWAIHEVGLDDLADRPVENLSGGQRRRAWIAMALAQDTEILLLDEPTTYLDMSHQLEVLLLLQRLNKEQNRTIVMVLHELNNAARFANYIIGMKDGDVVCKGTPKEVITKDSLASLYGIDANIILDEQNEYPICINYNIKNNNN